MFYISFEKCKPLWLKALRDFAYIYKRAKAVLCRDQGSLGPKVHAGADLSGDTCNETNYIKTLKQHYGHLRR